MANKGEEVFSYPFSCFRKDLNTKIILRFLIDNLSTSKELKADSISWFKL